MGKEEKRMSTKEERTCRCGNKFTAYIYSDFYPTDYMCRDCLKKDSWYYHMRCIGVNEKIKCIKCGWKLTYKDSIDNDENIIEFKCKCCGLRFSLWHPEPYDNNYYR